MEAASSAWFSDDHGLLKQQQMYRPFFQVFCLFLLMTDLLHESNELR